VDWAMKEKAYSQRHACALVGIDPKVYRYRSQRPDDAGLRQRLKELASQRRRFGYRRLHLLLEREGVHVNWKKLYRGVSGILCGRPVSSLRLETLAEDDGELGPGLEPFARRPFPVFARMVENKV
jgi:transposase InsO family protein